MKPEQIVGAANAVASVDERSANDACTSPECSFAFQPIYDIEEQSVFSFEALIRGTDKRY